MATSKGIRLMKAAKEFNIGKDTLVEFLREKKFEVENKPNTVLSEEMYDELMLEYTQDKAAKKKSEKISLQVKTIEPEPVKEVPKPTVKVSLKKEEAVKLVVKDKIELEKPKKEEPVNEVNLKWRLRHQRKQQKKLSILKRKPRNQKRFRYVAKKL